MLLAVWVLLCLGPVGRRENGFQGWAVGGMVLGSGLGRNGDPSVRGRGGRFFPLPQATTSFAWQGLAKVKKGAVGTECHPEGKMKDKR